ncbi:SHC-transforming protein 2 isoform X2 [Heptranchias perlo]|uniref:SHC-transforming protein 2 isoform X2 n=1 Tax=Heptranchias perlo TaxID=212740 RepID=UPI00355A2C18
MKPKYDRFRSDSVTPGAELVQSLTMSGKVGATPVGAAPSVEELEDPTTFCTLIPKIPHWKFSPSSSGFLGGRSPAKELSPPRAAPPAPPAGLAAVLGSCDSLCPAPCSPQATDRLRGGAGRKVRVDGVRLAGEEWNRKGSFINKPSQGWLHPEGDILGSGISYIVRYMGCIEVVKSMRSLDFNTRTQVTREAINRLHEVVPGVKGDWKKKPTNQSLQAVLGRSNLRFAGMRITVNISIEGLNLALPTTRQDTADYVAYVAKDPVNQRACHILECCEGLAQTVISTIGQAFELRFKQYLHSPPKLVAPLDRMTNCAESAWGEEETSDRDYYNSIPGKEPPLGGIVDTRSRQWLVQTQLLCPTGTVQLGDFSGRETGPNPQHDLDSEGQRQSTTGVTSECYVRPCAKASCEVHMYVNTQCLDHRDWTSEEMSATLNRASGDVKDSPEKDMFDMRPFEDALKLHDAKSGKGRGRGNRSRGPNPGTGRAVEEEEEELQRESWYHGKISRKEAEQLLVLDGDFLVRDSITNPGQYVLTGMHNGQSKHLLLVDPEGVVRTKDLLFENINHLINYHFESEIPIVAAESEVCLKQAIKRKQ